MRPSPEMCMRCFESFPGVSNAVLGLKATVLGQHIFPIEASKMPPRRYNFGMISHCGTLYISKILIQI